MELASSDKHHLADPALAGRLLQVTPQKLLSSQRSEPEMPRDGTLLGALFESLIALNLRVYAQAAEAEVRHLRTQRGEREVDFIVIGLDDGIVAVEVKLSATVGVDDTKHLKWLKERIGDQLLDAVLVDTGTEPIDDRTASRSCQLPSSAHNGIPSIHSRKRIPRWAIPHQRRGRTRHARVGSARTGGYSLQEQLRHGSIFPAGLLGIPLLSCH